MSEINIDKVGVNDLLRILRSIHLSPCESRILDMLSHSRPTSTRDIIARLYGHREDGGPDYAERNVWLFMRRIRRKGITIRNEHGRGYYLG